MTGIASFVILSAAKDLYVALSCGIEGSVLPYISMHPTSFREEPSFLTYIASDPAYKRKYLHAVTLVYDGARQPKLRTEEFAGLESRILILHPEKDIFIKEDQEKLSALLAGVGAETKHLRGGHLAFVSSPELYIEAIRAFLNRL